MQLILKQSISSFITYEIPPDINSIKDFSEVLYTMSDHEWTPQIKYDDISMKTELILTCFGGTLERYEIMKKPF